MSNEFDTGGPAFPTKNYQAIQPIAEGYSEGMTLRDYFAAKAMQGLLAGLESGKESQAALIPTVAYEMADAMLKARDQ